MALVDMIAAVFCVFALTLCRTTVSADQHCFTFKGNSYLVFNPDEPFDNSNSAHFELQIKTTSLNGVLMYAIGASGDVEALYIRGGNLHYHLFNTGRGGVGRQFGGHFVSEERVNLNTWITVHVYRSKEVVGRTAHSRNSVYKTGIEFLLNGRQRSYTDGIQRHQLDLSRTIYIGGYRTRLSETVGNFTGQIREITEHTNDFRFEDPSLNYKSEVDLQCLEFPQNQ